MKKLWSLIIRLLSEFRQIVGHGLARVDVGQGPLVEPSAASGIPADSGARVARVDADKGLQTS